MAKKRSAAWTVMVYLCDPHLPTHRYEIRNRGKNKDFHRDIIDRAGGTERDYLLKDESNAGSLTFNELKNVFKRIRHDLRKPIDIVASVALSVTQSALNVSKVEQLHELIGRLAHVMEQELIVEWDECIRERRSTLATQEMLRLQ